MASFPVKLILYKTAFNMDTGFAVWSFLGNLGLFVLTIRVLAALVKPEDKTRPPGWSLHEKPYEILLVVVAILGLIMLGLFPHKLLNGIAKTLAAFPQLQ